MTATMKKLGVVAVLFALVASIGLVRLLFEQRIQRHQR